MKALCRAIFSWGGPYPSHCTFTMLSLPEAVFGIVTIALATSCIYPLQLEIYYDSTPDPGQVVLNPSATLSAILAGGLIVLHYFLLQLAAHYRDSGLRAKCIGSGLLWVGISVFSAICILHRPTSLDDALPNMADNQGIDERVQDILDVKSLISTCGGDTYACAYGAPKLWIALCAFSFILCLIGLVHCWLICQEIKQRYLMFRGLKQTHRTLLHEEGRKIENYETISDHDDDEPTDPMNTERDKSKKKERYKYLKVNPLAGILQSAVPLPIHAYSASVVPIPSAHPSSSDSEKDIQETASPPSTARLYTSYSNDPSYQST